MWQKAFNVGVYDEKITRIFTLQCFYAGFYSLYKVKILLLVIKMSHLPSFNLWFTCRQDKDSKDETAKAEKELEEIRKVIEESGGRLSNRVLQCDVRVQLIDFLFFLIDMPTNSVVSLSYPCASTCWFWSFSNKCNICYMVDFILKVEMCFLHHLKNGSVLFICSMSLPGGRLTAPPLLLSSTQLIWQQAVSRVWV